MVPLFFCLVTEGSKGSLFRNGSFQIGRAHVWTPVTRSSRMPSSAWKKKTKNKKQKKKKLKTPHTTTWCLHTSHVVIVVASFLTHSDFEGASFYHPGSLCNIVGPRLFCRLSLSYFDIDKAIRSFASLCLFRTLMLGMFPSFWPIQPV